MLVEPDNKTLFEKILINVEFQSSSVGKEKIKIISEYRDYSKTYYGVPVLSVIVITDGFETSEKEYVRIYSDILRPMYINLDLDEIMERLNNLNDKIINQKQLDDDEALDMVFLPMFAPKDKVNFITERIVKLFRADKSLSGVFRNDIAFALSIMVRKYFDLTAKGKELLRMLDGEVQNSRLRDGIDFEVDYAKKAIEKERDELYQALSEKDKALFKKDQEIDRLRAKLKENGID